MNGGPGPELSAAPRSGRDPGGSLVVPPRPDLGPPPRRRRRWPLWVTVAATLAVVLLGAQAALAPLPSDRTTPHEPPVAERGRGQFAFLGRSADGPYRWDPCEPITYQVNLTHAPPGALDDVREAIRRVSEATGIRFVNGGTTTRTADMQLGRAFRGRTSDEPRYYPLLIDWVPHERFVYLADTRRAFAFGMPYRGQGSEARVYVSGLVAIDAGEDLEPGFGNRFSQGVVLMHELGHVMGLDHVASPFEIMWSPDVSDSPLPDPFQTRWGPGDLQGLRLLGAAAGCASP